MMKTDCFHFTSMEISRIRIQGCTEVRLVLESLEAQLSFCNIYVAAFCLTFQEEKSNVNSFVAHSPCHAETFLISMTTLCHGSREVACERLSTRRYNIYKSS